MTDFRDIEDEIPLTAIATDVINIKNELNEEISEENENLEVRYEIYDQTEENSYNCEACNVTFMSIEDHIRDCHADEDVIVKIQGDEDEDNEPDENIEEFVDFESDKEIKLETTEEDKRSENMIDDPDMTDDDDMFEIEYLDDDDEEDTNKYLKNNEIDTSQRATETNNSKLLTDPLELNDCVDKDGRPFNRKLVKINVFWNDKDEQVEPFEKSIIKKEPGQIASKKLKSSVSRKSTAAYKCVECDLTFSTARSYSTHLKFHRFDSNGPDAIENDERPEKFECEICHTVFGSNKSKRLHSRMHDPVKPRVIDQSHIADGASNTREYFHCEICNKSYEKQFEVVHMRMHSDEPNYHCTICNKIFNSLVNLEMHVNAHQEMKLPTRASDGSGVDLPYKCSFCGRQFSRPHEKVKHERIHTGEKPHICEICGKRFRVSYCLTLHMRTHTGARPYACPYCNKRFKAQSVYNHHLMTHSDSRPYQCPFCPKAFKTSVQLAGHKNSHTKPFSCSECNRPFATLYAVRGHMETHKKPNHNLKHKCLVCGATYARSFALRDHMKEQHSDIYDNGEFIDSDITTVTHVHVATDEKILPDSQIFSIVTDELAGDETADGTIIDEFETEEVVTDWILPKK